MKKRSANYNLIIMAARRASRPLLRDFAEIQQLQSSLHGADGFAEKAATGAEARLREELTEARPNYGWTSPGFGTAAGSDPTRRWIVNPICGGGNFLHGIPHWAVSIALEHKGSIVVSVLYDAFRNELYSAERGCGSWLDNSRMRAARRTKLAQMLVATGTDDASECERVFASLAAASGFRQMLTTGSPALDLAYVAAGRLDGFWSNKFDECEFAAGSLILTEAGALMEPFALGGSVRTGDGVLAASADAIEAIRGTLNPKA